MFLNRATHGLVNLAKNRSITAVRSMSVRVLQDEDAVNEFRDLNSKSVLYFTANWWVLCMP